MEGSMACMTPSLNKEENQKEKTPSQEGLIGANWPSLPFPTDTQENKDSEDSPIQPAQKKTTPWKSQQRGPGDIEKDRVDK